MHNFFDEKISKSVQFELTQLASTLPIRGKFVISFVHDKVELEWMKMSMARFHDYLKIVKDLQACTISGDADIEMQTK